jgi:hypothetical protein
MGTTRSVNSRCVGAGGGVKSRRIAELETNEFVIMLSLNVSLDFPTERSA